MDEIQLLGYCGSPALQRPSRHLASCCSPSARMSARAPPGRAMLGYSRINASIFASCPGMSLGRRAKAPSISASFAGNLPPLLIAWSRNGSGVARSQSMTRSTVLRAMSGSSSRSGKMMGLIVTTMAASACVASSRPTRAWRDMRRRAARYMNAAWSLWSAMCSATAASNRTLGSSNVAGSFRAALTAAPAVAGSHDAKRDPIWGRVPGAAAQGGKRIAMPRTAQVRIGKRDGCIGDAAGRCLPGMLHENRRSIGPARHQAIAGGHVAAIG